VEKIDSRWDWTKGGQEWNFFLWGRQMETRFLFTLQWTTEPLQNQSEEKEKEKEGQFPDGASTVAKTFIAGDPLVKTSKHSAKGTKPSTMESP